MYQQCVYHIFIQNIWHRQFFDAMNKLFFFKYMFKGILDIFGMKSLKNIGRLISPGKRVTPNYFAKNILIMHLKLWILLDEVARK